MVRTEIALQRSKKNRYENACSLTSNFLRISTNLLSITSMLLFLACSAYGGNASSIVAVVNGEIITSFDLHAQMEQEQKRMGKSNTEKTFTDKTLDTMINTILLRQEAERLHIEATQGDIDAELRTFLERAHLSQEDFQRQLKAQKMTEEAFRERIRSSILRKRLLANMVGRKIIVTKEEIAAYYDAHPGTFMNGQVHFAILVYPPNADAEKTAARLKKGTAQFDKVVRNISVGPAVANGGDVGTVSWNELDPVWQVELARMQPGEISDIFIFRGMKTQLCLLDAIIRGDELTTEEAAPRIEAILREQKMQARFAEYTAQLRKKAMITLQK